MMVMMIAAASYRIDDDRFLEQVRRLAADLPNTGEKVSHGRPAFFTKKGFAYYGGSLKVDGEWIEVAELLDASYRLTAPARDAAELDARS